MFKTSVIFSLSDESGDMEYLQNFLLEYTSFSRRHVLMDSILQNWLISVSLSRKSGLFDIYFKGFSGLFFKCARTLQPKGFLVSIYEL